MNSPSNRRHAWSWLPVEFTCGGLLFVGMAASIVMAQENPTASPSPTTVQPAAPPAVAAPEFLPRLSPNEQKLLSALSEPTEVAFNDNPLEEALTYLKDLHGIEIWIDKEALSADGIATDTQVSLNLSGITLRSGLRLLLEPLALTCTIEDQVLKITTHKAADKTILTRTYPVGDLFSSREEAEELVESLVCGLGLSQKGKEGPRPLTVSVPCGAIIARLSRPQNDQLLQLLRDLREAKALVVRPRLNVERDDNWDLPHSRRTNTAPTPLGPSPGYQLDEFSPGEGRPSKPPVPTPNNIEELETPGRSPLPAPKKVR